MLDPLKFQVAIQDEATGKLSDIEKSLGRLKDHTISVKVEGLEELRTLLTMLNQKQPSGAGAGTAVSQEVEKAAASAKAYLDLLKNNQDVLREFFRTGSLPKTAEEAFNSITLNIEKSKKSISECRAEIERLNGIMSSLNANTKVGLTTTTATGKIHDQLDVANQLYAIMGKINGEAGASQIKLNTENTKKAIEELGRAYNKTYSEAEAMVKGLFATGFAGFGKYLGGLTTTLDLYQLSIEKVGKTTDQVTRENRLSYLIKSDNEAISNGEKLISAYEQKLQRLKDTLAQHSQASQQNAQAEQKQSQEIKLTGDAMQRLNEQYRQMAEGAIRTALDALTKDLKTAKEAIQHDNFTAFAERIERCATAVNNLDEAFRKFHLTIGQNEGMRNFMTGLGEVIRNVRMTMAPLAEQQQGALGFDAMRKSISVASNEAEHMQNVLRQLQRTIERFGAGGIYDSPRMKKYNGDGIGFDTARLEKYKSLLLDIRDNLLAIGRNGGVHPMTGLTASQYLSQENVRGTISLLNEELGLYKQIGAEMERMTKLRNQLSDILARNPNTSYRNEIEHAMAGLDLRMGLLARLGSSDGLTSMKLNSFLSDDYRAQLAGVPALIKDVTKEQQNNAQAVKQAQSENDKWAESIRRASVELPKLAQTIRNLQDLEKSSRAAGIDTTRLSAQIAEMQNLYRIMESIAGGAKIHGTAGEFINSAQYQNTAQAAREEADAVKRSATEKENAARAAQQLTADEQRLAQALNQASQAGKEQSQMLSDLKSMAMQYLSVWGAQQFLHNIVEIGGQLEMQRLSIGSILQNTAQANELFDRIKGLAVQSPFGVVQLDQMTKQLTAYGFKYNELYDMTKRLADISAATGTDVSRLALALGHVRSEAALSGYTLRQFSMANVPLLQKLSEKLGKTTKEIRDMVKKKDISYEDVLGVLKDLTDEGGMFYNMQEVISESVKAKFKNVKDAMDIMYGEMAEGAPGDALKEVANALMQLTRNWKDVATVMGTVAAMWGINRAATFMYTKVVGESNVATMQSISAFRAKEAAQLRSASLYRQLTAAEKAQIASSKLLTAQERIRMALHIPLTAKQKQRIQNAKNQQLADMALALTEKKLTMEDIARQVALGKVTKAQAAQIISLSKLTVEEKAAAMAMLSNTKAMTFWGKAGYTAALGIRALGTALKTLIFNPAMMAMAAVTALMELWMRNNREMEAADELSNKIYEHSQESLKNTRQMLQDTGIKVTWKTTEKGKEKISDITGNFGGQLGKSNQWNLPEYEGIRQWELPEFDESDAESNIERWAQYIREYAATPNRILNEAFFDSEGNQREMKDQFQRLLSSVIDVAQAQDLLQDLGTAFGNAVNETNGGWFDESVLTNIADYDKEMKNFGQNVAKVYKNFRISIDAGIKAAREQDKAFDKAVAGMGTYAQQFDFLVNHQKEYANATKAFNKTNAAPLSELTDDKFGSTELADVQKQRETMKADLEAFYVQLEAELETKGVKVGSMSEAQQQALLLGYKDKLSSIQGLSEETASMLMKMFAERFNIKLDVDDEKFRVKLSEIIRLLRGLSESEWNVEVNFANNINGVIEEARKQYKAAKEYYENAQPIMLKFGIKAEMGQIFTNKDIDFLIDQAISPKDQSADAKSQRDFLRQTLKGWNEASGIYNPAVKASENGGFTLEEEKKEKKSEAYKDEFAKRWDERIRIMKEAYSWYDKWEKKVGNDAAIEETNAKYADIFNEWRTDKLLPMDFDVNEIADYARYVEKIRDDALKRYQAQKNDKEKHNGQEALRVYRQAVDLLNDVKFDNFTRAAEMFKSAIEQTISDLDERWDIFDKVREATGSVETASRIAGFGEAERGARTSADAMRNELLRQLRNAGGKQIVDLIPLDMRIDEESLRAQFENAIPKASDVERYKEKIDGLMKTYQEWQKLQKKVMQDDISVFANLIGSAVSYDAKLSKLKDDLKKKQDSNNALAAAGIISGSAAENANQIAQTQFDWEKMKLSADYANIYSNAVAMSRTEFDSATDSIERMLEKLRELGLISPEDYISERGKLDKARTEWSETGMLGERGAVGQFISGGYDGLMKYYEGRRDIARQKAERSTDSGEKKKWNEEADHYGKLFQNMSKLSDSAKDVITAFNTLQSGLDMVGGMFDALGMEGAANAAGDAAGILGSGLSGAQSLSSLGPWGMAAGAAMGLVTGIAQTHDKALERQIGKLREDVQQIEANTKLIQQARERTLGYDTGELRRLYSEQYSKSNTAPTGLDKAGMISWLINSGFLSKGQKDMYEYYMKNSSGTGYQQEYQNLLEQRKDYLDILNKQEAKKKKSQSDIEETKSKIAELDDQIRYFTDDLAKELFDIDIKGWADELSDSLASAFENGEDMAKAYRDTVTGILQQVANKMMKMSIIEPMFQTLQDKLFGNSEKKISGVFNPNDPKGSLGKVTSMITDFFGKGGEGEKTITAATEFMTAFQRGVQNAGLTVLNESSNTLSSGIQGTSEETSDLLASYVNALRQDVSVKRILFTQFVSEMWPSYIEQVSSIVSATNRIDGNVAAIRALLSENGALYVMIDSMRSHLDNVTNGNERVSIQ